MQINPCCAHACALSGHAHSSNEDLDNDALSFRNALRIDTRHCCAWCGLGNALCRQEKYYLATCYFQNALSVRSTSSMLLCYLGASQCANHQMHDSLRTFDVAINNDEVTGCSTGIAINPQAKFQRATMRMKLHRHH